MKKILVLSCSALALSVAAVHAQGIGNAAQLGQVNNGGAGNSGLITQIGDSNDAIVQQTNTSGSAGNSATVMQFGSNNYAGSDRSPSGRYDGALVQNGGDNTLDVSQDNNQMVKNVKQSGDRNTLTIRQRGTVIPAARDPNHRVWNVKQTGQAGAGGLQNDLNIDQRGNTNVVGTVIQENTGSAGANTATITQRGAYNGANINDVPPDPASLGGSVVAGTSHGATLKQIGSGNSTVAYQAGEKNNFWLTSDGDGNMVDLLQDAGAMQSYAKSVIVGHMNDAGYRQTGSLQSVDVAVTGDNFLVRTRQSGGSNGIDYVGMGTDGRVSIDQAGSGNTASANSSGNDQYIALKQRGDNNTITIAGLNGPNINKFYVLQNTHGNSVSVGTVDGSFNRLQFIQTGGDNNAINFGDVNGDHNKVFLTQKGNGNMIEGNIGDSTGGTTGSYNRVQVAQIGDDNTAYSVIVGDSNTAKIGQRGDSNMANVGQTGNNNSATIMQGGHNVNLPAIVTDTSVPFQTLDGASSW